MSHWFFLAALQALGLLAGESGQGKSSS